MISPFFDLILNKGASLMVAVIFRDYTAISGRLAQVVFGGGTQGGVFFFWLGGGKEMEMLHLQSYVWSKP